MFHEMHCPMCFDCAVQQVHAQGLPWRCPEHLWLKHNLVVVLRRLRPPQAYRNGGDSGAVVGGAIGGAALGGIVGAVTGQGHPSNVGTGAAIGGFTGGVLGATAGNHYDRGTVDAAFATCMNRGGQTYGSGYYSNSHRPHYRRGNATVRYCIDRYSSYNPTTGMYMSSKGPRSCP